MQRIICCYHKTGTALFLNVFRKIAGLKGLRIAAVSGTVGSLPAEFDIIVMCHSGYDLRRMERPFRAIHMIRDPRDIIVSGYLYHRRCNEAWCINREFSLQAPILFPKVPRSQQHRPEAWKRDYVLSLNGKSYQENLLERSQEEGLSFELANYAGWTTEAMANWDYDQGAVLELKFESMYADFDNVWRDIFAHLALAPGRAQCGDILRIAQAHDLQRMDQQRIRANTHISPGPLVKWRNHLLPSHLAAIENRFPRLLGRLGYE